jgi:hypothetical protein
VSGEAQRLSHGRAALSDLDIMRLHVEAEFTHTAVGDLVATNEPAPGIAPRFFLGQAAIGRVVRFRSDLRSTARRALEHAVSSLLISDVEQPPDPTPFERILAADAPIRRTSIGLAFRFPPTLSAAAGTQILRSASDGAYLRPFLAAWEPDIQSSPPLVAMILDGQAVAVCGSVRITPQAHEAGVETAAPFRSRGYGKAVVAVWSTAVRALGVEPIYSTTWKNDASRALACSLGLVPVGFDLHIT